MRVENFQIQSQTSPARNIPYRELEVGQFYEYEHSGNIFSQGVALRETSGHMIYFMNSEVWRSANPVMDGFLKVRPVLVSLHTKPA